MFAENKQFIAAHLQDDIRELALKLRSSGTGLDAPLIIRQIAGRQAVRTKLPSWYENEEILYPDHLPLEQCSSEFTAGYKASLPGGGILVDLTGGLGVDSSAFSRCFDRVLYVERQEALCTLAQHNFSALGISNITVLHDDAVACLEKLPACDCIFLDPARRGKAGNKVAGLHDCEPDILLLKDRLLEKAGTVLLKLSPMLDISLALQQLPETQEVHVVSVDNECKELLFVLKKGCCTEPVIYCVNLSKNEKIDKIRFFRSEEQSLAVSYASLPEKYLYEPHASLLKAGAFKMPVKLYPVRKLHPDSHLYTSDEPIPDFPGRSFRVCDIFSLNAKDLKKHLQGVKQAHITVRNFPASTDELRKKLKVTPGGDIYLFATTLGNGKKVIIRTDKNL